MDTYPSGLQLEDCPCPNGCERADRLIVEGPDRLHGVAGRFQVVRCGQCGLMRTNPRPTPTTIGAYYPSDYRPHQLGASITQETPTGLIKRLLAAALQLQSRRLPPIAPGELLEIGCASGSYLKQMQQAGWRVQGIEFSEAAAALARAEGLTVEAGSIEDARGPTQPVDLIAAWMVLEHVHNPLETLRKLRSWAKPKAYLVGSVPDAGGLEAKIFGSFWYGLQLPTHLFHYTPTTLAEILRRAGWELVWLSWQRNCNNLLWSLEYLANETQNEVGKQAVHWLRTSSSASRLRVLMASLLGATRQSGRMEFWARPLVSDS